MVLKCEPIGVKLVSDQLDYASYVTYNDQENYASKVIIQLIIPTGDPEFKNNESENYIMIGLGQL